MTITCVDATGVDATCVDATGVGVVATIATERVGSDSLQTGNA